MSRALATTGFAPVGVAGSAATTSTGPTPPARWSKGTSMSREEWERTRALRAHLVVEMGPLKWSQLTDAGRDEAVRAEVKRRGQ
jgi:hypothetical protein